MFGTSLAQLRSLPGRRSATLLLAALLSLVLLFAATAVDVSALIAPEPRTAATEPAPRAWTGPEIPREWTWQRDAITFDHMYREGSRGSTRGVDWIRENGSR